MAIKGKSIPTPLSAPAAKAAPAKPAPAPVLAKAAPAPILAKAPAKAVDPAERQRMIADAAYFIAEKRGFAHGNHDADWAEAERQIDELLKKRK